jgi:hypothetical protein
MLMAAVKFLLGFRAANLVCGKDGILEDRVTDPVIAHVHGFGSVLFDRVVGNAAGSAVVGLNGCGSLPEPMFRKGGADGTSFLATCLCFCSAGDNFFHEMGDDVDSSIS